MQTPDGALTVDALVTDVDHALTRISRPSPLEQTSLAALLGDEQQVRALFDALDQATQHSLIREVPGAPGRYSFAHALMRSALYEELTTNRRVRMHWKVGEVLESRFASRLDAHLDELAYHFGEGALAGDPSKAVEYARRAGERFPRA